MSSQLQAVIARIETDIAKVTQYRGREGRHHEFAAAGRDRIVTDIAGRTRSPAVLQADEYIGETENPPSLMLPLGGRVHRGDRNPHSLMLPLGGRVHWGEAAHAGHRAR